MTLADSLGDMTSKQNKAKADISPTEAVITNAVVTEPVNGDWSHVLALFNLSADEFEVVDDTVRCSTWQTSKRTDSGDRDVVQLYSYSARFKRKPAERLPEVEIEKRRKALGKWTPRTPANGRVAGRTSVAAVINLADIQGGKDEGGGVKATQKRLTDGLENVLHWLRRMEASYDVNEVVLVNNGDPIEGCDGSYASQLFSVELNLRGQMNFVLDMWELYARELFPQYDKAQFVSVLCNHGQLSRQAGRDNRTDDADNVGGFLAETLQRTLSGHPAFEHVAWTIPHAEMNVYTEANGIPLAFNHGHKIPSSGRDGFEKWLNGQARGDEGAHAAKAWVTAHRHHFAMWDLGSCTVMQCPSLDGGSKWFRDRTGNYSRSGILAFLVGNHAPLAVSDWAFL